MAVLSHPITLTVALGAVGGWVFGWLRLRHFDGILTALCALPAGKRRYTLEREYGMHPGEGGKPLTFVRRTRKRWLYSMVSGTAAAFLLFSAVVIREVDAAGATTVIVDDGHITPNRYGYYWRVRIDGSSPGPVMLTSLKLTVLERRRHPVIRQSRPVYARNLGAGQRVLRLGPNVTDVPILSKGETYAVHPGHGDDLELLVLSKHEPGEGWIYKIRLEGEWKRGGYLGTYKICGHTIQIGWPGLPPWSPPSEENATDSAPVVDPPRILGE